MAAGADPAFDLDQLLGLAARGGFPALSRFPPGDIGDVDWDGALPARQIVPAALGLAAIARIGEEVLEGEDAGQNHRETGGEHQGQASHAQIAHGLRLRVEVHVALR